MGLQLKEGQPSRAAYAMCYFFIKPESRPGSDKGGDKTLWFTLVPTSHLALSGLGNRKFYKEDSSLSS